MTIDFVERDEPLLAESRKADASVAVLRSPAELEDFRSLWQSWPGHRDSDLDFFTMILQSKPGVLGPHVLVLYRSGRPCTILMGRAERTRIDFRIGYFSFLKPRVRMLSCIPWGMRGDDSFETSMALVKQILQSLRSNEFDVATLAFLDTDSSIYKLAKEIPSVLCRDHMSSKNGHWRTELPRRIDEMYQRFSTHHRKRLRQVKRLQAEYGDDLTIKCFKEESDVGVAMRDVERVARTTYQRGLGVGFHISQEVDNRLRLQAKKGWLRAYIMYIREAPCAFWIGSSYKGTFYSDYIGHDPAYDKQSIGTFLTIHVIEELCQDGTKGIDFGPGEALYKQQFGTVRKDESTIHIYAPTWKGISLNAMRTVSSLFDSAARKLLKKTHLLSKIKKVWRTRVADTYIPGKAVRREEL